MNKSTQRFLALFLMFLAVVLTISDMPASASEKKPIVLRVADFYPPAHPIRKGFLEAFAKPLEERSNGRIKVDYYGHETLVKAKDILDATISGVADIGNMTYAGSKVPVIFYHQLPGVFSDEETVAAARAMWKIQDKYIAPEFEKLGLKLLYVNSTSGYQVMNVDRPIRRISDFEGTKLRVAGAVLPYTIKELGAVPVSMTMGEVYEALERGVISGLSLAVPSLRGYAFYEVIKYATVNCNLGGYPSYFAMNMKTWRGLPDDIKQMIESMSLEVTANSTQIYLDEVTSDLKAWREKGIEIIELPKEDQLKAAEMFSPVWKSWTETMTERGYPMKELIADWKEALISEGIDVNDKLFNSVK